jgi:uncharacterized protein (UPF0261 family)
MSKTVVLVGAMDTKSEDFGYVKSLIEGHGVDTLVVDFGVMGEPGLTPDIGAAEVAKAGGGNLGDFASGDRKDQAMSTMAKGVATVVRRLYDENKLDGVLGMGGSGGTSVTTAAMRELPVGVPKVMVSTVAGGDVSAYAGTKDITFIPSVVDVAGLNRISKQIYANAAGAIAGMVNTEVPADDGEEKPLVTASMFGNTTDCVNRAKRVVEAEGYEVLVFHATGTGGQVMESLIADGFITGSLDITTTELADEICGGVFSAGPERMQAASKAGIPAVIVPGCVDMVNFGGKDTMPEKYHDRNLYEWNPNVTLMRTNAEENQRMGKMIAVAANMATAPVAIVLPMKGVSMLDSDGQMFWDPEADKACYDAIRENLKDGIPIHEVDHNINDPAFADFCANLMLEMLTSEKQGA